MIQDKNTLKSYFEIGDFPTEAQFADLIDSFVHIEEGNTNGNAVSPKTIFINTLDGDDITATTESSSKPFKTIDAALEALPAWDGEDHWVLVLISAGTYIITKAIPRRNITFSSSQKVSINIQQEGNITQKGHNTSPLARITFDIPFGTYTHTFSNKETFFWSQRISLHLNFDRIQLNYTGNENYTSFAYFNLGAGYQSYGSIMKINVVETNIAFFYGRKFSPDTENVRLQVEIGRVIIKQGNEFAFFREDYRYDLVEAAIKVHSFINESSNYVNMFLVTSTSKKNIYIGNVIGQGNAVFLFSGISNGFITFLNSELSNTYFARSWTTWTPGYRQFAGTILKYKDTNGAVVQTTSHAGSTVYFKNLFIKEFNANNSNAWIFDLWQNSDARGQWIFENCHFVSNCRTLRNGGSTDRIKLVGINVFDDAGDTTNYSIDKRSPNTGQFQLLNEGILKTKTIRNTANSDGNPAVLVTSNLTTF
ncbi:hypothetical protein [Kordia sp.]|uniref:hypothetical protein n=1 Tax=Kordia sp. TaxID=1965332 RepID=UPI003B58B531